MEFYFLLKTLLRKKWIILSCVVIAVIVAFLFTLNRKTLYKSTSQISTGFTVTEEMKLSDEHFNLQEIEVKFSNLIAAIASPQVLQLLSYDLILHDLDQKKPFYQLNSNEKSSNFYKNLNTSEGREYIRAKQINVQVPDPAISKDRDIIKLQNALGYNFDNLSENLQVSRLLKTDYINVSFKSKSPELSAYVVNTLIAELSNYYNQDKHSRTDSSVIALDSLVQQKKSALDLKTAQKSAYLSDQHIVDINLQGGTQLQQISSFESQLVQEKGNQQELEFRIQQLTALIKDAQQKGLNAVTNQGMIADDNDVYLNLRKQYNDTYKEYIQKGNADSEVKKKLDDISERMRKLRVTTDYLTPSKTSGDSKISLDELIQKKLDSEGDLKSSTDKIAGIQNKLGELRSSLNSMATQGVDIDKLNKEIEIASVEYSAAKERLNNALNISNGNSFKQTVVGQPAIYPEPTYRGLIIALAGIAAFILSSILLILLDYVDQSIKTPSQFKNLTHLPLLGSINYLDSNEKDVLENIHLTENNQRKNIFRELLRKLRYEIENSGKKIFLFTSTESGQGKTTLIQALAFSLNLNKKRVLIIDTNFCNNDLTKQLNAKPTLEGFHVNGKPLDLQEIHSLISKTRVQGVDTIGCDNGDYTPNEVLPANHLLNYLNELLKWYDFIFLEGAPLNSYTDTKELIKYSDGLIAVFSSEISLSPIDKESINYLRDQDEKFLGAILNKVQVENLEM